jgi:hypothetical protein
MNLDRTPPRRSRCLLFPGVLLPLVVGCLLLSPAALAADPAGEEPDPQEEQLKKQKQTMGDMRSIAITVESYKLDNAGVPGPTDGDVPVSFLRPFVQPVYIRVLPVVDGWGHPILYWSDGEHYRIVSHGRDGQPDGPYEDVEEDTTISSLDGDIIFTDGRFIQYPVGPQS